VIGEDSLLEGSPPPKNVSFRCIHSSPTGRTWLKMIAWAAAEGLALETFPVERIGEFYEEATRGRSASHHLQVKSALALLYHVLGSPNPFTVSCAKVRPEETELR
jgi:hypothetical protein